MDDPLIIAAWLGEEANVRGLMQAKAHPTNIIASAMVAAAENAHQKVVQAMLACRADANSAYAAQALSIFVQQQDCLDVVPVFLTSGLSPKSKVAGEVFEYAADKGQAHGAKVVSLLLGKGLSPTSKAGGKALQLASQGGHDKLVRTMLDAKASGSSQDGRLALRCAALMGQYKVVQMLLAAGAQASSPEGSEALNCGVHIGADSIVKLLLKSLADPSGGLGAAAFRGNEAFVKLLLQSRADQHSKRKAMKEAARFGHAAILELLLAYGSEADSPAGRSSLRLASRADCKLEQKIEVVTQLERSGARWFLPSLADQSWSHREPTTPKSSSSGEREVPRWYSSRGRLTRPHSTPALRKGPNRLDCDFCYEHDYCILPVTHPPYKNET